MEQDPRRPCLIGAVGLGEGRSLALRVSLPEHSEHSSWNHSWEVLFAAWMQELRKTAVPTLLPAPDLGI